MKVIHLIRHAKSDWKDATLLDFDRPLNKRGLHDIPLMGEQLIDNNFDPEVILCSPAKRTALTAKILSEHTNIPYARLKFDPSIYEASLDYLIYLLNNLSSEHKEIAIIGHNPSITSLSNYLTDSFISNMPTCSTVKIELEINNWNEIIKGIGVQKYFLFPKMFY